VQIRKIATGRHQFGDVHYLKHLVADPYLVARFRLPVNVLDTAYVPPPGYDEADFVDHDPSLLLNLAALIRSDYGSVA
jgi:hypothetical protein